MAWQTPETRHFLYASICHCRPPTTAKLSVADRFPIWRFFLLKVRLFICVIFSRKAGADRFDNIKKICYNIKKRHIPRPGKRQTAKSLFSEKIFNRLSNLQKYLKCSSICSYEQIVVANRKAKNRGKFN